jgi:pimeloyl-ACP methyl ester carboxylesterase
VTQWKSPPSHHPAAPDQLESVAVGPDGTRLYVRRRPGPEGVDAPTVLLCDGILCDGFIWKYLWDDLASVAPVAHWHYRGHGRSAPPADPERVDVVDFARDLDAVRRHVGDGPVVLVGHSFGVQVALEAFRLRPENVRGLVLCCGAAGRVTQSFHGTAVLAQILPKLREWVTTYPDVARALWSRVPVDLSVKLSYVLREVDVDHMKAEDLLPYLQHMTHVDFALFVRALTSAGEHSAHDLLPQVKIPALVIGAERDTFTPPALAEELAHALPGGEYLLLARASHAALIEQPERVREAVTSFLGRLAPFEAKVATSA